MNLRTLTSRCSVAAGTLAILACASAPAHSSRSSAPTPTPPPRPIEPAWRPPSPGHGAIGQGEMAGVVARTMPVVVAIDVEVVDSSSLAQLAERKGAGSGWIIDGDGLIVTNAHVVRNATFIDVTLHDGRVFPATRVAYDSESDLAVLRISASGLPTATIGDSARLVPGTRVAVLGNVLGKGTSMNGGWVSRLGVSAVVPPGYLLYDLIETDAAVNPGNSGGPMIDMAGEVVGITNAKLVAADVEGIGFAIPIHSALPIITELVRTGTAGHGWIGVLLQTVTPALANTFHVQPDRGVLLIRVEDGSPAGRAGLATGDVVTRFDGHEVLSATQLIRAIRQSPPGRQVQLTYWRGGAERTVAVTPSEAPAGPDYPSSGLTTPM